MDGARPPSQPERDPQTGQLHASDDLYRNFAANIPGIAYRATLFSESNLLIVEGDSEPICGLPIDHFREGGLKELLEIIHGTRAKHESHLRRVDTPSQITVPILTNRNDVCARLGIITLPRRQHRYREAPNVNPVSVGGVPPTLLRHPHCLCGLLNFALRLKPSPQPSPCEGEGVVVPHFLIVDGVLPGSRTATALVFPIPLKYPE